MIMELLTYIKNLLGTNKRKRSAADDLDTHPVFSAKVPRISSRISLLEDDWLTSASLKDIKSRRKLMEPSGKNSWPRTLSPPIVLDDDDSEKKLPESKFKTHTTSTPILARNGHSLDGYAEKYKNSSKKTAPKNDKFEYIQPQPSYFTSLNSRSYKSPLLSGLKEQKFTFPRKLSAGSMGSTIDFSIRLDEKRKYEELMNKTQSLSSFDYDSFAEYSTPIGKIPPVIGSRTRKIVNIASRPSLLPVETINLTNGDSARSKQSRLSTKDTILKVLEDNEVVVIKDSDSDVEILPNPPSPKPDIKIQRVNSLKTIAHPSEPDHDDWVKNKIKHHNEEMAKKEQRIRLQSENLNQIREITEEVRSKQLADQVKKCLLIKDVILPIEPEPTLPVLTATHAGMIKVALDKTKNGAEVLASKFSLKITRRDMLTLAGLNWLNDEVINFYMNLIIERGKTDKYPPVYAFNTFFYPKLLKDGHSSIRRWTRKIDVFSYNKICVPIHLSMHWCMAVIDLKKKYIGYYDSMGKSNYQCVQALLGYLQEEHKDKKKSDLDVSDWKAECVKNIPQQMNGSDCGMFSCTYAEYSARNAPFDFTQEQMPYFRQKMVVEIMLGNLLIS